MTQAQAILKHLRNNPTIWIHAYDLEKVTLCGKWIGTRGARTARDMVTEGLIDRMEDEKGYVQYRAKQPQKVEVYRVNGEVVYTKKLY